jgi:hydrogen peroxide-dependent heme synthase
MASFIPVARPGLLPEISPVEPAEGWHVLHLFYSIDRVQWSMMSNEEQLRAKTGLTELVSDIRGHERTQLLTFAMVTPKADLGFMLLTSSLQAACEFEKRLTLSLGPGVLTPTYSCLSMTERSEYTTTRDQYIAELKADGLKETTDDFQAKLAEWEKRMEKYAADRLYPNMSDWPVFCFYPMSKKRDGQDNWFALDYETRRKLMAGHQTTGRRYAGKIRQLITGCTGLDEHEWFVTLQAKDTVEIKAIVYEMRFDEVSARYGEFGDFYLGLQLPLLELFRRVCL